MHGIHSQAVHAELLEALQTYAADADAMTQWPAASLDLLKDAGVFAWSIPAEYGGQAKSPLDLLAGYEQLASACLTTAFILSQREAAVRRLIASPNVALASRYLPALARGDAHATVGLSQLTTSRQHQAPVLVAEETADGFRLDGLTPWVTGARHADLIVLGATLTDGRQLLLGLPRGQEGVAIEPPLPLMALVASATCTLKFQNVTLSRESLIAGPAEKIMAGKPGGVGGLETSCLALGLASAAVEFVGLEAQRRPDLAQAATRLEQARQHLRVRLHALASVTPTPEDMAAIRVDCSQLALQATQVAMTVAKGAGFVIPHPVQRWTKQALFFLVWSCPRPAAEGLIGKLLP